MEPLIVKTKTLIVGSPAFRNGGQIPVKYTCEGANLNPPLTVNGIPGDTKSLVLIVEDPDAPSGVFVHWLVWNISPQETLPENNVPGVEGTNSFEKIKYQGPCPPGGKVHRYFFKLYALNAILNLKRGSDIKMLERAMENHVLAYGELIGMYARSNKNT